VDFSAASRERRTYALTPIPSRDAAVVSWLYSVVRDRGETGLLAGARGKAGTVSESRVTGIERPLAFTLGHPGAARPKSLWNREPRMGRDHA